MALIGVLSFLGMVVVPVIVGKKIPKGTPKRRRKMLAGFISCLILFNIALASTPSTDQGVQAGKEAQQQTKPTPKPTLSPEEQEEIDYKKWVEYQFSAWDGSHIELVRLVKENMNDPGSFQHVETRYVDNGTGNGLTVYMKFRGKNAFGGLVINEVTATTDYKTNMIKITN